MNKRAGSISSVTTPMKTWLQGSAYAVLFVLAIALIVLAKTGNPAVEKVRTSVVDGASPLMDFVSRPVTVISDTIETAQNYVALKSENEELRRQNEALRRWQVTAARLKGENANLRNMLNMVEEGAPTVVTGRVIADQGGAFVRSVVVNAGRRDGVKKGLAAMTGLGLAGRVAEVGRHSSRVVLLTDISSRIPVFVGTGRHRAVVAGNNSPLLSLLYLDRDVKVNPGDRVFTSGHGGALTAGLPVGIVASVADGVIRVRPYVEWNHMDFVRLEDYSLQRRLDVLYKGEEAGDQQ